MKTVRPSTYTLTEIILSNASDEKVLQKDREAIICLDNLNVDPGRQLRERTIEVVGGTEEKPLRLNVSTDYLNLIILNGHVDIVFTGRRWNKLYISRASHATISVSPRQKITLEGQGSALVITASKNRVQDYTRSNKIGFSDSK